MSYCQRNYGIHTDKTAPPGQNCDCSTSCRHSVNCSLSARPYFTLLRYAILPSRRFNVLPSIQPPAFQITSSQSAFLSTALSACESSKVNSASYPQLVTKLDAAILCEYCITLPHSGVNLADLVEAEVISLRVESDLHLATSSSSTRKVNIKRSAGVFVADI